MEVKRFVNGKPVSENIFKSISIKSANTEKIIVEAAKRAGAPAQKDAE